MAKFIRREVDQLVPAPDHRVPRAREGGAGVHPPRSRPEVTPSRATRCRRRALSSQNGLPSSDSTVTATGASTSHWFLLRKGVTDSHLEYRNTTVNVASTGAGKVWGHWLPVDAGSNTPR